MLVHTIDTNVRTDNHEAVETILAMLAEYQERTGDDQHVGMMSPQPGQPHVRVTVRTKRGSALLIYVIQSLDTLGAFNEEN